MLRFNHIRSRGQTTATALGLRAIRSTRATYFYPPTRSNCISDRRTEPPMMKDHAAPFLPVEIEIEIIRHVPLSYYDKISKVCSRWHSITLLLDVKYMDAHSQTPRLPSPSFKPFSFKLHRAIYELDRLFGGFVTAKGFIQPRAQVLDLLKQYENDQITIPPMPHTLQSVKLHVYLPPSATRPNRPGHVSKVITIPSKKNRRLLLNVNPHNSNDIEVLNLDSGKELPGITVGEFFETLIEKGHIRAGDLLERVELKWRVDRNTWWKEWDLRPGFYEFILILDSERVPPLVWAQN